MAKHWMEVKDEIENELDKIFWDKPIEFQMSEKGMFPSGAGTDGSALGNMYFLIADTSNVGRHVVEPAMWAALNDDSIDVETIKKFWNYLTGGTCRLLGSEAPPNCPAPWLNQPNMWKFYNDIVEAFPTIKTKADFQEVYFSWANYLTTLNRWAMICYPWEDSWDKHPKSGQIPAGK